MTSFENTKLISLTQGKSAIVDAADYEWLMQWKWRYNAQGYAVRQLYISPTESRMIRMHRAIVNAPDELEADHINGDRIDNRRSNLRLCNSAENKRNRRKPSKKCSSRFKGVNLIPASQKWRVQIKYNKRSIHLGCFDDEREAALCYNEAAIRYFGEFAQLNIV